MSSSYPGPPPTQPPDPDRPTYGYPGDAEQQPQYPHYGDAPPPQWAPRPGHSGYPPPGYPRPDQQPPAGFKDGWTDAPRELRPVVVLLLVNLGLSVLLTIITLVTRHSIIDYQLDHRHITDPQQRALLRDSYSTGIITRVISNIVVSVVYVFLVRALLRGRRWAYRRVIILGALGIVALLVLQATPYPAWMRVEQLLQALVLGGLLYFVLRPQVKAHFDPSLPGRNVKRFRS